jgi:hypothetical protein
LRRGVPTARACGAGPPLGLLPQARAGLAGKGGARRAKLRREQSPWSRGRREGREERRRGS